MHVAGIISEYNPFHLGHCLHISETRKALSGNAYIVCAMSGNFVQRGDFAVFDKHSRAAAAVYCGADLVVELPLTAALSSAEGFAMGGVGLLNSLGVVTHLSFGSESGSVENLREIAEVLASAELTGLLKDELSGGLSFAAARQRAVNRLIGEKSELLAYPNDILGIEYLKALRTLASPIMPITVTRQTVQHDSAAIKNGLTSASNLREIMLSGGDPWGFMPEAAAKIFKGEISAGRGPVWLQNSEDAILARLRSMTDADYAALPDGSEGLYKRLMRYARTECSIQDILEKTKTKRYAMARLRRMIVMAYLGIKTTDRTEAPPYIKVLAFNNRGRELIREADGKSGVPIITKPAHAKKPDAKGRALFELEAHATDLYVLGYPDRTQRYGGQEWLRGPVIVSD